jgi:Tfp pilus assembly protein PilF
MFRWFQPRCPVSPGAKQWIEARMGWLIGQFGWHRLRGGRVILPTDEYFPDHYDQSEGAARELFERTCGYMDLDPARLEMRLYRPEGVGHFNRNQLKEQLDWAGLYDADGDTRIVWVDADSLIDPESLVATLAHELAHELLLGQRRISADEEDLELLTDLTTVFFGMGVLGANVALRQRNYSSGVLEGWTISRQGYLPPSLWAYALALFAWLRHESRPAWMRSLRLSVRSDCLRGLKYLQKTEDATVVEGGAMTGARPVELLAGEFPSLVVEGASSAAVEEAEREEETMGEQGDGPDADEPFAAGVFYARTGQWREAILAFSAAIRDDPDDGEAYQQRTWAYLEYGQNDKALADAQQAVRLAPDDPESYRARGTAYLQAGYCERAIDDFTYYIKEEDVSGCDGTRPARGYYFRGLAYAALGDVRRAVADYDRAILRWRDWPEPYEARADAYDHLGMFPKARDDRAEAARRRGV